MRRIVITGMGVITPLGHSVEELITNQLAGRSGVAPITHFDASTFPTRIAAEVRDFDLAREIRDASPWQHSGAHNQFAVAAAQQALAQAGFLDDTRVDRTRFGIYMGTGEGAQDFDALVSVATLGFLPDKGMMDPAVVIREGLRLFHPRQEHDQELHVSTALLADYFGLEGPNYNCLTACAASSQALGEALELIRSGQAEVMLAGGSHSMIHPFGVTGFNLLTALSTRNEEPQKASRPFDLQRDGFVLGEGAGVLILEELEHARGRGVEILAELRGYGSTADAWRVTDSHEEGRGAIACIRRALKDAQLSPEQIGYVNAHGTSTKVNDSVETLALKAVLGEQAYGVPVSSSKSMLGHLIAAAGAVELITCIEAIRRGVVPPTINYTTPDPDCDLDYVPNQAREVRGLRHALSNSFGFGGQNISLVVSRFEG